jgi:diaminopimelate epimerase
MRFLLQYCIERCIFGKIFNVPKQTKNMPALNFYKYQGAGNDFVMLNIMNQDVNLTDKIVKNLCDRHFGIGGDGLITISKSTCYDFKMRYYNSDGPEASFCGNGGRCAVALAHDLQIIDNQTVFEAFDGIHTGRIIDSNGLNHQVEISMKDAEISINNKDYVLVDTGSPHFVTEVDDPDKIDIKSDGAKIRYNKNISKDGVNVNFIHWNGKILKIRTYERGVEDETLACGTGITASAISICDRYGLKQIDIEAKGGKLHVNLDFENGIYKSIKLCGPAEQVFSGTITI